jgi:hypothetical protein
LVLHSSDHCKRLALAELFRDWSVEMHHEAWSQNGKDNSLGNVVFELNNRASLSVKVVQLKIELRFLNITINIP